MSTHIQPAYKIGGGEPEVVRCTINTTQNFGIGAPVSYTVGTGAVSEHALGATVTGIYGFAMEAVASSLSAGPDSAGCLVCKATDSQVYSGKLYNSGIVAPDADNLGRQYGLVNVSDKYYVDESDTTDVVVEVMRIDTKNNLVYFKVITSARDEG